MYILFSGGNGYCGCDWEEALIVDDNTPIRELDQIAYHMAMDYADDYDYVAEGYNDGTWDSEEAETDYYEGIDYNWVELTEEEYNEFWRE